MVKRNWDITRLERSDFVSSNKVHTCISIDNQTFHCQSGKKELV